MSTDAGQQYEYEQNRGKARQERFEAHWLCCLCRFTCLYTSSMELGRPSEKAIRGTKRQFDASLDFVKTIATIAGGIVLYLNFRVAKEKLEQETEKAKNDAKLAEARLTMERFSKAVDMMGSDKSIHLRLGGIYALESIALDSSDDKIDENYRQVLKF